MGQNVKEQINDVFSETCKKIYAGIVSVGVLCTLIIFPLFYRDYYFDILESKYIFYYITMLLLFAAISMMTLIFLAVDALEFQLWHTKEFFQKFSVKNIKNTLSVVDLSLIIFLVICIISTLQSDYLFESFWGNEGRFSGLFLHLIYGISFLIISHFYDFKKWHLYLFLSVAMLPLLFGITDYFCLDILDFKKEVAETDINAFTSTFGNINTYVTYVGIVFGCLSVLLVTEQTYWKAFLYFIGTLIASFAMIMGNSDNGFFAIGMVFGFLPLLAFQNRRGVERYVLLTAGFFSAAQVVSWISGKLEGKVLALEGVSRVITSVGKLWIIVVLLWAVWGILLGIRIKNGEKQKEELGNLLVKIWTGLLVLGFIVGIFMLYDANLAGHSERYGALGSYLKFSDEWGNYRGMIWRITMESYAKQPFSHKLWGYGLDTFGVMTVDYREETSRICGQVYDSAHNEYLQYLVTIGPLGLLAYLSFLVSSIWTMLTKPKNKRWSAAVALAVICYLAQAAVTINLPIVTPIMWMLLSMGVACSRKNNG